MASVLNSLRSISSDDWWFVKISFYALFVFILINGNANQLLNSQTNLFLAIGLLSILMLGTATVAMYRNTNNIVPLFPSLFSIPEFILKTIIGILCILPGSVICYFLYAFCRELSYEPFVMNVIYVGIGCFCAPIILSPLILYSGRGKLRDALKLNIIMRSAGNFLVQVLNYLVQSIFLIALPVFLLYKLVSEMFGQIIVLPILYSYTIVVAFFSFALFLSDLFDEVLGGGECRG
ncbi:MAG: hypothetical protein LUG16_05430 [Candidatus Gastranaerophilales bacterium]|nr:hypothetical protein [Candidatus Gastranaerophilales bacterium]